MRKLRLSILQELARLETQQELEEAIVEILDLLEGITDWMLATEEEDNIEIPAAKPTVNPFEGQILWTSRGMFDTF